MGGVGDWGGVGEWGGALGECGGGGRGMGGREICVCGGGEWGGCVGRGRMSKEPYNDKGEVFYSPIVNVRKMRCSCVLPSVGSGMGGGGCPKSHTMTRVRYSTAPL